jgi:hypothetical protein
MSATEWKLATPRLWLVAAVAVTGYLVVLLVVWCFDGLDNVGWDDPYTPWLVALPFAPIVSCAVSYKIAAKWWKRPVCRALFATAATAPSAVVALFVRALMGAGM